MLKYTVCLNNFYKSSGSTVQKVMAVSNDQVCVSKAFWDLANERLKKDPNDKWANEVLSRLSSAGDLVAAEACYHTRCYVRLSKYEDIGKV